MAARKTSATGALHLIKLAVGVESVAEFQAWRAARAAATGETVTRHWTRMAPKRAEELLDGGSLYWVVKGVVRCRQRLLDLRPVTRDDGAPSTEILLEGALILTENQPRRPFQGWRYLTGGDAPADLARTARTGQDALPPELDAAIAEFGIR